MTEKRWKKTEKNAGKTVEKKLWEKQHDRKADGKMAESIFLHGCVGWFQQYCSEMSI